MGAHILKLIKGLLLAKNGQISMLRGLLPKTIFLPASHYNWDIKSPYEYVFCKFH